MELDKEKIKQVLLSHGLSTRRCEQISEDLASRDLEKKLANKPRKTESKTMMEVVKEE